MKCLKAEVQVIKNSPNLIWDFNIYFLNDYLLCTCDMAGTQVLFLVQTETGTAQRRLSLRYVLQQ